MKARDRDDPDIAFAWMAGFHKRDEEVAQLKRELAEARAEKHMLSKNLLAFEPSNSDIHNACLSYRHDFGLMNSGDQALLAQEALWWLRAWSHTLLQFKANEKVTHE